VVLSRIDVRGTAIELDEDGVPRRRTLADLLRPGWSFGNRGVMPKFLELRARNPRPDGRSRCPTSTASSRSSSRCTRRYPAVSARYAWDGDDAMRLHFRPLLAMRGVDERGKEHGASSQGVRDPSRRGAREARRDLPQVCFAHGGHLRRLARLVAGQRVATRLRRGSVDAGRARGGCSRRENRRASCARSGPSPSPGPDFLTRDRAGLAPGRSSS